MKGRRLITALLTAAIAAGSCCPGAAAYAGTTVSTDSSIALAKPTITGASKDSTHIRLKWSKVRGASGYKIYRRMDGKWRCIKTVEGSGECTLKLGGFKSGRKYRFKVRAYKKFSDRTVFSKYSPAKRVTTKEG